MKVKLNGYLLLLNMKTIRTMGYLSFVLFCSACATAVVVEQPTRENDDRTELQKQLDSDITKKINKRFKNSEILSSIKLHISTYKHVVTINGFVENERQKATALRLTSSVSGVKTVISDIGIQKD
ncbi:MAG: BON domain-containing protein [Thiohalomonadales bacterium]